MFRHRILPFPCLFHFLFLLPFPQSQDNMYDKHLGLLPMAALTTDFESPRLNRRRRVRHRVHTPAYASFTGMSKGFVLYLNQIRNNKEGGWVMVWPVAVEVNRNFGLGLCLGESS